MTELKYVTYCGLYCRQCSSIARIPVQARTLYDTLKREGYEFFGPYQSPAFNDFWKYLQTLTILDLTCSGCRGGCGDPGCKIRLCSREKGHEICVDCHEYPCKNFDSLTSRYPNLLADGRKLKELGIDSWITEQEKRCARGYCLSDGRYE